MDNDNNIIDWSNCKRYNSVDEMMADIERKRKERPIYYFFYDIWGWITDTMWEVKTVIKCDLIHRIKHGHSKRDIWDLDYSTAKWLLPRLYTLYRECEVNGHMPGDFWDDELDFFLSADELEQLNTTKWLNVLSKIIIAMELLTGDWIETIDYNVYAQKLEEGLDLYRKYFTALCI